LKFAFQSSKNYYYTSNTLIADSLKNKIKKVIASYPTDTTFLYKGDPGGRFYCGNSYVFLLQKNDRTYSRIYFEPQFLPDDLTFLYNYLYEDRQKQEWKKNYTNLFKKLEDVIMSGENIVPLPLLKETIQFTPPVIKKKR
jgi:hypothetical protein